RGANDTPYRSLGERLVSAWTDKQRDCLGWARGHVQQEGVARERVDGNFARSRTLPSDDDATASCGEIHVIDGQSTELMHAQSGYRQGAATAPAPEGGDSSHRRQEPLFFGIAQESRQLIGLCDQWYGAGRVRPKHIACGRPGTEAFDADQHPIDGDRFELQD